MLAVMRGRAAPTIGKVLQEALERDERRKQEKERRESRGARRTAGLLAAPSMPVVVERTTSAASANHGSRSPCVSGWPPGTATPADTAAAIRQPSAAAADVAVSGAPQRVLWRRHVR